MALLLHHRTELPRPLRSCSMGLLTVKSNVHTSIPSHVMCQVLRVCVCMNVIGVTSPCVVESWNVGSGPLRAKFIVTFEINKGNWDSFTHAALSMHISKTVKQRSHIFMLPMDEALSQVENCLFSPLQQDVVFSAASSRHLFPCKSNRSALLTELVRGFCGV